MLYIIGTDSFINESMHRPLASHCRRSYSPGAAAACRHLRLDDAGSLLDAVLTYG